MPPERPDRDVAAIFYFAWPVGGCAVAVAELARGEHASALRFAIIALVTAPLMWLLWRRDSTGGDA